MKPLLLDLIKNSDEHKFSSKIETLLKNGENPDTTDPDLGSISILMIAVSIENIELMELLIKYKANVNFENKVLSRCMINNFFSGFNLIIGNSEISKESIEFALFSSLLENNRISFTKILLETKKEICLNAKNAQNINALEFAKRRENIQAIELLEEYFT